MARRKSQPKSESDVGNALYKDQLLCQLELQRTQNELKLREFEGLHEELERSRNFYARLYNSAATGHVTFNAKTLIQAVNLTAAGLLGRSSTELVGLPFTLLVAQSKLAKFFEHLRFCREEPGEKFMMELDFLGKHKEKITQQIFTVASLERGEISYQSTLIDVSAYKTVERNILQGRQFSEAIIQTVHQPLVVLDERLNVVHANAAFYREFKFREKIESRMLNFSRFMGADFIDFADRLSRVVEEQKGFENFEYKLNSPTGHPRFLIFNAQPFYNKMHGGALLVLGMEDITHRHEAEEVRDKLVEELGKLAHELEERVQVRTAELRRANKKLQRLSARMLEAQESERRHLARELHDEIGQQITCLQILAENQLASAPPPLKNGIKEIKNASTELLKTVRQLSSELRPQLLDDFGLVAALEWHIKRFRKRTRIEVEFDKKYFQEDLLNSFFRSVVFRVAQEALTNVARHAKTNKVSIELSTRHGVCKMGVHDEGKGFNVKEALRRGAYGLTGMQERVFLAGGKLKIDSGRKKGTTVALEIPLISLQGSAVNPETQSHPGRRS